MSLPSTSQKRAQLCEQRKERKLLFMELNLFNARVARHRRRRG
jgi:hypothetical protein